MTSGTPPGRMYLIDAHALIFQMFHAIPGMTAPDGRATNALFGVSRDLLWLHAEVKPEYLIAAFDLPQPTFRDAIYAEYKKHRPAPPDDLESQIPLIRQVMEAMNVPVLAVPGFEADDVLATVATRAADRGTEVFICTSDKDCRQLINDRVRLFNLRKHLAFGREELLADWGITPEQVVDFQTLVGDSVDNVPGVPGIGAKTAAKLLQQYGTLDNLVAHADEISGAKMKANLKAAAESGNLEISRKLVRLDTAMPLEMDWEGWKRRDWDAAKLVQLFREFGFRRFEEQARVALKTAGVKKNAEILALVGEGGKPPPAPSGDAEETAMPTAKDGDLFANVDGVEAYDVGDFAFGANATADAWQATYQLVDSQKALTAFLKELKKQKRFAVDLETTSLDPLRGEIVGYAFSWKAGEGFYLAVRGPEGEKTLDPDKTLEALKPVLQNAAIAKVNQNIKYDQLVLRNNGVELAGVTGDPMVAHYLLHAGERSHNLDEMTRVYFNHENIPISQLIGKGKNQVTLDKVSTAKVADYSGEDADAAWRLTELLETDLQTEGLKGLYDDLEVPLIDVLADMEFAGVRLDVPFLQQLSVEMARQLQEMEAQIHALAGRAFNIASPKQLREVLFNELKLPVQKRTDLTNEASTDQESLERLAALGYEIPRKIIEHRQVSKLKGTYVDALPALVNPKTGRVHTSFNQTVTSTGRLSSSDPNLQNIPARTEQGRQIRQAFLPREGWLLLTADYSQIELRLLAHFTGDEALRKAFAEDRDVHTAVAAEIFKVPEEEVTSAQRRVAKTVNFGVLYGMSAHGLSVRLSMPRNEAETFIDEYFARYPKVLQYQDNLLKACRKAGYVSTILGRRRKFDKDAIRPRSTYQSRNQGEREAINMEIQGSAADLMKVAMLNVHRRLKREQRQAQMLLSVHDELVFEVPPKELAALATLVREEMTGALKLDVPLKVDVSAGPNWLDVKEV